MWRFEADDVIFVPTTEITSHDIHRHVTNLEEFPWFLNARDKKQASLPGTDTELCDIEVVGGPSTPHDLESNAGGSLSSWQGHPSR
jgi:hypothetical protein